MNEAGAPIHWMSRRQKALAAAAIIGLCLFAIAFAAAPRSCEGGLEFYAGAGLAALCLLALLPFAARVSPWILPRAGWSVAFVAFGVGVWLAGLFAANVRIMCRLF